VSDSPVRVRAGLDAVLLTPTQGQRQFLHLVLPRLLVDAGLRAPGIRRFLAAAPALPEMGLMYQLLELLKRKTETGEPLYEVCVVDAPATGHALALAQIPTLLLQVIPTGRIGAVAREGLTQLTDPAQTGVVAVTLPERLPVSETLELCQGLRRYDVPVAAVVVNRVPADPFEPAETRALASFLDGRPVAGRRLWERLGAARAARDRLEANLPAPLLCIPELAEATGLLDHVAAALAPAGVGA
jgi:arsenite/tail-anchored protein-transporting ATPase